VKEAPGQEVNWIFESAGPNTLVRRGWNRNTLKIGDRINERNHLVVDANSAIKLDIAMEMGEKLRLELHQCGSSAIRHAVHLRGRTSSRATFSSELSTLERFRNTSQCQHRFLAVSSAGRHDRADAQRHLSVQRELLLFGGTRSLGAYITLLKLCRLAGTPLAGDLLRESR
jgi:hypothetical protein